MAGQPIFFRSEYNSLIDILRERISHQPDKTLYTFLSDGEIEDASLTYAELDRRARAIAVLLQENIHQPGERVLLLYPPGLDYVSAFWGCLYAGMVAVPSYPPRLNRPDPRLETIAQDAQAQVALTTPQILASIEQRLANTPALASMRWMTIQDLDMTGAEQWQAPKATRDSLAFLQYSSGSTAKPKGVMVSHGNLIHTLKKVCQSSGLNPQSRAVIWVPAYHDMGLIGGLLEPIYAGITNILMHPMAFLQKPVRWLQAISRYRGTICGGPNFGYALCVQKVTEEQKQGLDLSSWRVAFSGAEPVQKETLEQFAKTFEPYGFQRQAFFPTYGLVESTLMAACGKHFTWPTIHSFAADELTRNHAVLASPEDTPSRGLVSCGGPAPDEKLLIVDPQTLQPCSDNQVGEIWLAGPSITQGYWNHPEETIQTFQAHLTDSGEGPFLRSGDLGFIYDGEVFIAGRAKDLVIIRGRNHYPQDIEITVQSCHPATVPNCGAAFSIDVEGEEKLVIVEEVHHHTKPETFPEIIDTIRQVVAEQHELQVYTVVLIRIHTIPKTSSNKIQRRACKSQYLNGTLMVLASSTLENERTLEQPENQPESIGKELASIPYGHDVSDPAARQTLLTAYLQKQAASILRIPMAQIDPQQSLNTFGIDSMMAVELKYAIETALQVSLPMEDFLQEINISELATRILELKPDEQNSIPFGRDITPSAEYSTDAPLSHGQRALWFIHQLAPGSAAYNVYSATRIRQPLDVSALQQAFEALVERHPALRTTFHAQGDEPFQRVAPQLALAIQTEAISGWSDSHLNDFLLKETQRPFDLERGPLMRVTLLNRSAGEHILLLVVHHIIVDFWSLAVFADELGQLYAAQKARTPLELAPLTLRYSDYVYWQTATLAGAQGARLLEYWQRKLSGDLPALNLPTDRPRPPSQTWRGGSQTLKLSRDLTRKIKDLGQQHGTTLYMTLLAAFQVLLHRYTGQADILVGSPTAGRSRAELASLMGYFVNPVVLRADFSENPTFNHFLAQVRQTALEAFAHQDYPFSLLVEHLQPRRDINHSPIFQVMFVLQKTPLNSSELAAFALNEAGAKFDLHGLALETMALEQLSAQFDLTLAAAETADGLGFSMEYNRDLFDPTTVQRMLAQLEVLLDGIVTQPDAQVDSLPMVGAAELHQLMVEWNATEAEYPQEKCIHELFEAQAEKTPEAVAVIFEDRQLTYRELNTKANQLAHSLRSQGVGPDVLVGICMERSLEMIVGLLGILKAGGAYVPLDPTYPKERLKFMLDDGSVRLVLTQAVLRETLEKITDTKAPIDILCLDSGWEQIAVGSTNNLAVPVDPDNLAYIIYTSGSTGIPKGVGATHRNVMRLILPENTYARMAADEVFLVFAPLAFDASTFEIWGGLLNGARLVIFSGYLPTSNELADFIHAHGVTTLWLTAGLFHQMVDDAPEGMKTVRQLLAGGDVLSAPHVLKAQQQWPACRLINGYGPTENTTFTCCYNIANGVGASVSIGQPIANTQVYILDSHLRSMPMGVLGELHIAGDGLTRGYLNRPDLTAEKFIPNPFSNLPGALMYRSGDLARYLPASRGNIEYLGRIDSQIKIRGFRIELGEIEAALAAQPEVREVVVLAREDLPGDKRLAAYLVAQAGQNLPETATLRSRLSQSLPEYMIPAHFVSLEQLPLTPNGKIDRRALPAPDMTRSEAGYVAPRTPTEETLTKIWAEVLKLDKVGIHDNFFELGGHSLLATQVISKIRSTFQIELPLQALFGAATVAELSPRIDYANWLLNSPQDSSTKPDDTIYQREEI